MKLKKILDKIEYTLLKGSDEVEIKDIAYDSRKVEEGFVFVAIVGNNVDGHDYIESAVSSGASVVIVSKKVECKRCSAHFSLL